MNQNLGVTAMRLSFRAIAITLLLMAALGEASAQSTRQIVPPANEPQRTAPRSITETKPAAMPSAQPAEWRPMAGSATAIGANAEGEVWVISNTPRLGPRTFRLQNGTWHDAGGTGVRIAVGPAGNAWVVQANGAIVHYTGATWESVSGSAIDIAVGANGAIWIIEPDQSIARGVAGQAVQTSIKPEPRGRETAARTAPVATLQYRWEKVPGAAVRIAVDPQGNPWVVNASGQVYHYTASGWVLFPVSARDVAVGPDGVVYLVGTNAGVAGFPILRSDGTNWVNDGVEGESIAAGSAGMAYVIKAGAGGALVGRLPNRASAGTPPVLPKPTAQPVQQVWANSPSGQTPTSPNGVRQIGGTQPSPTKSGSTSTQTSNQNGSGTVPIPLSSATIQVPQAAANGAVPIPLSAATIQVPAQTTTTAVNVPAPNQPVPITPPNITQPAQGVPASSGGPTAPASGVVVVPLAGNLTLNQPGPISAPTGTITVNPAGSISVNPTKPPSGPSGTSGSLVVGGPPLIAGTTTTGVSSGPTSLSSPSTAPLQVTGLGYVPISVPAGSNFLIPGDPYVYTKGKLLCSDPEANGLCGNVDAGFVGGYTLNTVCSSGFYDMTNGGTCWQCPATDSNGAWIRSADAVTSNTACWRNATSSAHWDKYGLAWDCSSGEFWDSQDQNHNVHGSCWDCPSDYPTRSADAVQSSTACYGHQTSSATLLKYNGCPTPDKTKMYPGNDMTIPGEPFLDIASGISVANDAGGACWACPNSDQTGNYLYTERNVNTLIGRKTGNNGCKVDFKYKPAVFSDPGLSGLPGVADVFSQEQVFQRPAALTTFLYGIASGKGFTGAKADAYVAAQWQDIAAHPYQNANIKALMYEYVTGGAPSYMYASGVIGSGTTAEQAAQTKLLNSFQEYIRARRTYVAQEALDMYYAWKNNVGVERSEHAESELMTLFYYGTVPLDFQSIVASALVPSVTGVAVMSSVVGAENYASIAQAESSRIWFLQKNGNAQSIPRQFRVSNVLKNMFKSSGGGSGEGADVPAEEAPGPEVNISPEFSFEPTPELTAEVTAEAGGEMAGEGAAEAGVEAGAMIMAEVDMASGPVGIALAGAAMAAVAIQQVVQIAQAEPNLISAKNTAMNQVNLSSLLAQPNGPDQAAQYWSDATGVANEPGLPSVTAQASQAYTAAQQSHFAQVQAPSATPNATAATSTNRTKGQNPLHKN